MSINIQSEWDKMRSQLAEQIYHILWLIAQNPDFRKKVPHFKVLRENSLYLSGSLSLSLWLAATLYPTLLTTQTSYHPTLAECNCQRKSNRGADYTG